MYRLSEIVDEYKNECFSEPIKQANIIVNTKIREMERDELGMSEVMERLRKGEDINE